MKRIICILAIVTLLLSGVFGCGGVKQVVDTGQQVLCNPTTQEQAEAAAVLQFIQSGIQVAGLVVSVPVTAAQVQIIFSIVQNGGCVVMSDLQMALAWYDALVAQLQTKARAAKGITPIPPATPSLHNWVKK